jgi:hypothetical protein
MNKICEVVIYTESAALSFNIIATTDDFQERLASALEEGTVVLDTAEGSRLVLNAINVVAIEIQKSAATENLTANTPPAENI